MVEGIDNSTGAKKEKCFEKSVGENMKNTG